MSIKTEIQRCSVLKLAERIVNNRDTRILDAINRELKAVKVDSLIDYSRMHKLNESVQAGFDKYPAQYFAVFEKYVSLCRENDLIQILGGEV